MKLNLFLKGEYTGKNALAKLVYPFGKKTPYAIELLTNQGSLGNRGQNYCDLNAFRPDIRSFPEIMKNLKDGIQVTVLYENLVIADYTKTKIPRYIIYKNDEGNTQYFVNVR